MQSPISEQAAEPSLESANGPLYTITIGIVKPCVSQALRAGWASAARVRGDMLSHLKQPDEPN